MRLTAIYFFGLRHCRRRVNIETKVQRENRGLSSTVSGPTWDAFYSEILWPGLVRRRVLRFARALHVRCDPI